MEIQFVGATADVTGSMTLLTNSHGKMLIDCGLYQGVAEVVKKNLVPLPFDPRDIKAIVLTHAHLDHSGFIPRLIKKGFRGEIFCTKETMKLARIIMADSAKIMEKNEDHLLHNFYATEDVAVATSLFKLKKINEHFEVLGMAFHLLPAGHILGASSVFIQADKKYVFSGDLGRSNDPLIKTPPHCPPTDVLVIESTYGGRVREGDYEQELISFLRKIKKESKVGIIASFAVARAQSLITLIYKYYKENPDEKIRLVIDGPMMTEANKVYREFAEQTKWPDDLKEALEHIEVIDEAREWESLSKKTGPLLIITSSGMVTGGRIWRYLENWQDDENACLFLPGYQAKGTSGKALSEGDRIIYSEEGVKVKWTGEVISSQAFSSHADQTELIEWMKDVEPTTEIYLNHGETTSKNLLKTKLMELGYKHVYIAGEKK